MFPVSISREFYCIRMSHSDSLRLFFVMLTFSRLCLLLISGYVDSSLAWFSLRPVLYPARFPSITYPTGRYSCLVLLHLLRLLVLVSLILVYILGWRWDDPHLQSTLQPP